MLVAMADGNVSPEEVQTLQIAIMQNRELQPIEQRRLGARLAYLSKKPLSLSILNRFKERSPSDKEAVARLAVSVAAADGRLAIEEIRLLEKIYKTLQIPTAKLYSELQATGVHEDVPPTVAPADAIKSIPIPPKPHSKERPVVLDQNRLARTRADTAIVSSILGDIFRDDEEVKPKVVPSSPDHDSVDRDFFEGLNAKYVPLMTEISGRRQIARDTFEALAMQYNVMCDGAIEAINDWSYSKFDEPILDDGPTIIIHGDLLNKAKKEAA
jgi:hypothetical protein